MTEYSDIESFQTHLKTLGIDVSAQGPDSTMAPDDGERFDKEQLLDAMRTLPRLNLSNEEEGDGLAELRVLDTLGEGGMGVVRLANQLSLDREVAVKTTREIGAVRAAEMLLEEAYVTGYLEHPNIIPIYTIGRDDDGAPLIVMKCVEGKTWLELLKSQQELAHPRSEQDLRDHVEILIQVCNAVRFAHSRGIIHRDIKAENIMIGNFGEVYLLDWGVALSLTDEKPLLPRRSNAQGVCGTPCYMAPEMALEEMEEIDERTDVYLLGATLHHVLTGSPRHQGDSVYDVLFAAYHSEPVDFDDEIPADLAAIVNRACHRDREQRFSSAQELAEALQDFLQHRESFALSTSAEEKRAELQLLLDAPELDDPLIHDTYGECRFGFHQALRIWKNNEEAIDGLQHCLESMVDYHLRQSNLSAARACIDELAEPRQGLEDRAAELATRLEGDEQDLQRLKRLESNLDLGTAMKSRSILAIFVGTIWTATGLYAAMQEGVFTPAEELQNHMEAGIRNVGIALFGVILLRKRLMANRVNRRLVYLLLSMVVSVAFLRWSVWYLGEGLVLARTADFVVYVMALIAAGLVSDKRMCLIAIPYAAAAIVGVVSPDILLYANAVATALTFGAFAWIWRPSASRHNH